MKLKTVSILGGLLLVASQVTVHIGSLARDFHIGFDPDYEFN